MQKIFKIQRGKYTGDNWIMCFGRDCEDNEEYAITTNNIKCSEMHQYIKGAKDDAELVCELLNLYINGLIKINWDIPIKEI